MNTEAQNQTPTNTRGRSRNKNNKQGITQGRKPHLPDNDEQSSNPTSEPKPSPCLGGEKTNNRELLVSEDLLRKISKSLDEINESLKVIAITSKKVADHTSLVARSASCSESKYTIADSMEVFDRLLHYGTPDPDTIFQMTQLLEDNVNREIFMNLADDTHRMLWIKGAMSKIKRGMTFA